MVLTWNRSHRHARRDSASCSTDGEIITKATRTWVSASRERKIAENMTYPSSSLNTDRLDYLAPLANNVAYALDGWKNCSALKRICRRAASTSA